MSKNYNLFNVMFTLVILALIFAIPVEATRVSWEVYTPKEDVIRAFDQLCDSRRPYCGRQELGRSIEGRPIMLYKIGNPFKPAVLWDGSMHGVEDSGTEITYEFAKWLLQDRDAEPYLKNSHVLIIPIVNPDSTGRQNHRRSYLVDELQILVPYGVDLNRNFPAGWGEAGSTDPEHSLNYIGYSPASEPETQAVIRAIDTYKPVVYVNYHLGMETQAWYAGNRPLGDRIISNAQIISADMNVTRIPLSEGANSGGYAQRYAYSKGANAWLIETNVWEDLPDTRQEFLETYYPQNYAFLKAQLDAVSGIPPSVVANEGEVGGEEPTEEIPPPVEVPSPPVKVNASQFIKVEQAEVEAQAQVANPAAKKIVNGSYSMTYEAEDAGAVAVDGIFSVMAQLTSMFQKLSGR